MLLYDFGARSRPALGIVLSFRPGQPAEQRRRGHDVPDHRSAEVLRFVRFFITFSRKRIQFAKYQGCRFLDLSEIRSRRYRRQFLKWTAYFEGFFKLYHMISSTFQMFYNFSGLSQCFLHNFSATSSNFMSGIRICKNSLHFLSDVFQNNYFSKCF